VGRRSWGITERGFGMMKMGSNLHFRVVARRCGVVSYGIVAFLVSSKIVDVEQ
jgi:hypothetical protein